MIRRRTARRRGVAIVAAHRDSNVVLPGPDGVGGVVADPAASGHPGLRPGVGCPDGGHAAARVDVAAHVAGRHAHGTGDADEEVREVLTDPAAQPQHLVHGGGNGGGLRPVLEVPADGDGQPVERVLHRRRRVEVAGAVALRHPPHAGSVHDRRPEEEQVLGPVAVGRGPAAASGLDHRATGHLDQVVLGQIVEVVHVVAEAVLVARTLMGATDGTKAPPATIRGDFALSVQNNLVHGSDSPENAKLEIGLWFKANELVNYQSTDAVWIG